MNDSRQTNSHALILAPRLSQSRTIQVVNEFRAKLRQTEDLISQLTFNLKQIQGAWTSPLERVAKAGKVIDQRSLFNKRS